jgi:hypothetical protein
VTPSLGASEIGGRIIVMRFPTHEAIPMWGP